MPYFAAAALSIFTVLSPLVLHEAPSAPPTAVYTLEAIRDGEVVVGDAAQYSTDRLTGQTATSFSIARTKDEAREKPAMVDLSLVAAGGAIATSSEFVDLSWDMPQGVSRFAVFKDNEFVVAVDGTSYRDVEVSPGQLIDYRVESILQADAAITDGKTWGFAAVVPGGPTEKDIESTIDTLHTQLVEAQALTGATVRYRTFIPQDYVTAPDVGCSYASPYKFGGDLRGYSTAGGTSRTSVTANVRFNGSGLIGWSKSIGTTAVYDYNGSLVDSATASSDEITVSELIAEVNWVDLDFSVVARNPFCIAGAIVGSFIITVTDSGNYAIVTGSHRQMPNHEVYVRRPSGAWATAYQRDYADMICLIGWACPEVSMSLGPGTY